MNSRYSGQNPDDRASSPGRTFVIGVSNRAWSQAVADAKSFAMGYTHANPKRAPRKVRVRSAYLETMPLGDAEDFEWLTAQVKRRNPVRTDRHTIMDYLDADDHVRFGGQA